MFKTQFILLMLVLGVGVGVMIFPIRQNDLAYFEELLKSSNPQQNGENITYAKQIREDVHKHVWYQDNSPLYFSIESKDSELFFFKQENQVEIVEQLDTVVCVLQEKLFYLLPDGTKVDSPLVEEATPWQQVRYIEAGHASYHYNTSLFVAEDVTLWTYQLEGHTPPKKFDTLKPMIKATAENIEFTLKEDKPDFTARHIHAVLNADKKGLAYETQVEADNAHYDGNLITLEGNVVLTNALGTLCANRARLTKDENKSTHIEFPWIDLEENVQANLSEGGTLNCSYVHIDYLSKTSEFVGDPHVMYADTFGEVYADQGRIDYDETDGTIDPKKITLIDHVCLINRGTAEKPSSQYALADQVDYFPREQLIILETIKDRVLFFDQKQDMQLSAKTVHAKRDPITQKETIQGIGDVRFIFGVEELEKMKQQFKLE